MSNPQAACLSAQPHVFTLQVAGETEVKAQIKLRIRTAAGVPVVIIRSFLVSPCSLSRCWQELVGIFSRLWKIPQSCLSCHSPQPSERRAARVLPAMLRL